MLGGSAVVAAPALSFAACNTETAPTALKGNINHSVCRWTFDKLSVEELCVAVKNLGFAAIDLVGPDDWPTLKKYGVYFSMRNGAEIRLTQGWKDKR